MNILRRDPLDASAWIPRIAYILFCILLSLFFLKDPMVFWDMLPYMGAAVSVDTTDPETIHSLTYASFYRYADTQMVSSMVQGHDFCKTLAENPAYFSQQLPFYKIKLLYVYTSWGFYKLGTPLFYAVLLPVLLAFWGIALLIFYWLEKYFVTWFAFLLSSCLLLIGFSSDVFRIASPDALSALFLLFASFFILEKKSVRAAVPFLLLAVLTRPENAVITVIILTYSAWISYRKDRKNVIYSILGLVLTVLFVFICRVQSGGFRSYTLFYHTFNQLLVNPGDVSPAFNIQDYISGLIKGWKAALTSPSMGVVLLLLFLYRLLKGWNSRSYGALWMVSVLLSFAARALLFPHFEDRYIFVYLLIFMILVFREVALGMGKEADQFT